MKLPYTPRSIIKNALRKLFLRSRERRAALKREDNCCQECKKKQTRSKGKEVRIEVHHIDGSGLEELVDLVYNYLLCNPDKLKVLCKECHDKEHKKQQ